MRTNYLELLADGDMRTTGNVDEVVKEVLARPETFSELFACLEDPRPGVKMRTSDAVEKITRDKPVLLLPFLDKIIKLARNTKQQEVQWHIAQIVTYVPLSKTQNEDLFNIMLDYYLTSSSNIVKVFSLTALVHLSDEDLSRRKQVTALLEEAVNHESPSVKSRARALLKEVLV